METCFFISTLSTYSTNPSTTKVIKVTQSLVWDSHAAPQSRGRNRIPISCRIWTQALISSQQFDFCPCSWDAIFNQTSIYPQSSCTTELSPWFRDQMAFEDQHYRIQDGRILYPWRFLFGLKRSAKKGGREYENKNC